MNLYDAINLVFYGFWISVAVVVFMFARWLWRKR